MKDGAIILLTLVAWSVFGHGRSDSEGAETEEAAEEVAIEEEATTEAATEEHKGAGDYDALVASVETTYDVPAWYIDATRLIESNGKANPTVDGDHWFHAKDLSEAGSACEKNGTENRGRTEAEARKWCQRQWTALQLICSKQATKGAAKGTAVCDANTVVVSKAFAMGEMQILPTNIVADGVWQKIAVDYDGDGAVNPLSLPDAMAMSAKLSRAFHDQVSGGSNDLDSWMKVADKYRGESVPARHAKLRAYGATWCETHSCGTHKEELTSR